MRRLIKICNLIFCMLTLVFVFQNCTYAAAPTISSITTGMKDVGNVTATDTSISKIINIAIGALQVVGTGISVIVVTLLGLKYVMASAQDKADIKKQAVPIVIGCVLLFAASNIVKVIADYGMAIK